MYAFLLLSLISFSSYAQTNDELAGNWFRSGQTSEEAPLQIIQVKDTYYIHTQESFVFEDGRLSHTIDQSVKLPKSSNETLKGTVDFYDSRGCSFRDLEVVAEFQNKDTVNVLMTVPRYQFVTISTVDRGRTERPRYCRAPYPYYPYYRTYICGYDPVVTSSRNECRVLEYVQVPVQLNRVR